MRPRTPRIHEMMRVYDPDGRWVGLVSAVGSTHFEVTGGPLHDMQMWDLPMSAVREVRSRERLVLRVSPGPAHEIDDDAGSAVPPYGIDPVEGDTAGLDDDTRPTSRPFRPDPREGDAAG